MFDVVPLRILTAALAGWVNRHQLHRVFAGREPRPEGAVERAAPAADRWPARRLAVAGHRLGRQGLHAVAMLVTRDTILRSHRQLIARKWTRATAGGTVRGGPRNPPPVRPDGAGKSHVGLSPDSARVEEPGASRRPLHHRHHAPDPRDRPRAGAADVVAHVSGRPLKRDRRRGFLYDRGVDRARAGHVLQGLRD